MNSSMNVCVLENEHLHSRSKSLIQTHGRWAVKLIVHENAVLSNEDFLNFISMHIPADSIHAFVFDTFYNFHILFLDSAESFCILIGMTVKTETLVINFLPLLDFFVVDNVYPCTSDGELRDIFENFAPVFHVNSYLAVPSSAKFSHVISGKREISFILPSNKTEVFIPVNVFNPPYRFRVKSFCPACVTEGHRVMNCPNIEDIKVYQCQSLAADEIERNSKPLIRNLKTSNSTLKGASTPSTSKASNVSVLQEEAKIGLPPKTADESSSSSCHSETDTASENVLSDQPPDSIPIVKISERDKHLPDILLVEDRTKSVVVSQTESSSQIIRRKLSNQESQDLDPLSTNESSSHTSQDSLDSGPLSTKSANGKEKKPHMCNEVRDWLRSAAKGVLPSELIEETLCADVWTPSTIAHRISGYSSDFQLIVEQLDDLLLKCLHGTSFYYLYPKIVLFKKVVKKLQNI